MTAHRILIVAAVVFFAGYAGWEMAGVSKGLGDLRRAALSGIGAVALGFYFRSLKGK